AVTWNDSAPIRSEASCSPAVSKTLSQILWDEPLIDCLYDVRRRNTRRYVESIALAIDASPDIDLVAFPIEAQFMTLAEIDKHPRIARHRGSGVSPHQYSYLACQQM